MCSTKLHPEANADPLLVAQRVMLAVIGHPVDDAPLARQAADHANHPANRSVRRKAAVCKEPVITETDANSTREPMQPQR
jgi:hypothetical protein